MFPLMLWAVNDSFFRIALDLRMHLAPVVVGLVASAGDVGDDCSLMDEVY